MWCQDLETDFILNCYTCRSEGSREECRESKGSREESREECKESKGSREESGEECKGSEGLRAESE